MAQVTERNGGRAAAANIVPSSTGAAIATTKAMPEHAGNFDGVALRVPVSIGSIADTVMVLQQKVTIVSFDLTQVMGGDLVKVMSWYDNEWGFTNQMVRMARKLLHLDDAMNDLEEVS